MRVPSPVLPLLAALALACSLPAGAQVRVCVDKDGRKSYQQGPCPALGIATGIQPLKVGTINESGIRKSVALMNKAFAARDTEAFLQFLAAGFTAQVTGGVAQPKGKPVTVDRARYAAEVAQAHRVMLGYEETVEGGKVTLGQGEGLYQARIRGRTRLPQGDLLRDSDQAVTFVIEGGLLVVSSMRETVRDERLVESAAK